MAISCSALRGVICKKQNTEWNGMWNEIWNGLWNTLSLPQHANYVAIPINFPLPVQYKISVAAS